MFLLWRYIYTPVSIGKMERFYKKHHSEMEQLAAYANRAVDDSAYLWSASTSSTATLCCKQ